MGPDTPDTSWKRRDSVAVAVGLSIAVAAVVVPILVQGKASIPPSRVTGKQAPVARTEAAVATYSGLVQAMKRGEVQSVVVDAATGKARVSLDNGFFGEVVVPPDDDVLLRQLANSGAAVEVKEPRTGRGFSPLDLLMPLVFAALAIAIVLAAYRRARAGGASIGAGVVDTSLRPSQLTEIPEERFADVAGCDEAVEELDEIVQFF